MAKPPDRTTLIGRIAGIETKLSKSPRDGSTAEASIDHAALQISYWRLRQILASLDTQDPDFEIRKAAFVESRKCSEQAAEWERRKSDSAKLLIARKLEELAKRIDEQANAGATMRDIETD